MYWVGKNECEGWNQKKFSMMEETVDDIYLQFDTRLAFLYVLLLTLEASQSTIPQSGETVQS